MELSEKEQEDFIICPNCSYMVPRTPVCIRCGFKLPSLNSVVIHEKFTPQKDVRDSVHPTEKSGFKSYNLANYIIWRSKLIWLLDEGRVSEEVFKRIYSDYTSKINEIITKRGKLTGIVEKSEVLSKLKEAKNRLDELRIRHELGEIPDREYLSEYTNVKAELSALESEATKIEFQYRYLQNIIGKLFGRDLSKIKEQIERCYLRLPSLIQEKKILDRETAKTMKNDLDLVLRILKSVDYNNEIQALTQKERHVESKEEDLFDEELLLKKVTDVVKGHDDEIRRIIRAIKLRDNVLIIGRHAEGKTELLLQLHKCLGGIYFHCHEEVSEREIIAGFNPSAFVGKNPIHKGCLMRIVDGDIKGFPIAFIDEIMKLRPRTQIILFEAMNNKRFCNPVDGKIYYLPPEFSVVSSSNIDSIVQETPDIAFLDRFGKIVMWQDTPDHAVHEILKPYNLPNKVEGFLIWIRHQVNGMRYLVPVSIRNLQKFAQEYNRYRKIYQSPEELKKLAVDRLLKVKVLNLFGLKEFDEVVNKIERYVTENFWDVL